MTKERQISPAEENRLRILIEQLQRQGKSEQEITSVIGEAVAERIDAAS